MDSIEKELPNLTTEEKKVVLIDLESEISYEQHQYVREIILRRANNVPYATLIQTAIEKYIGKTVQELSDIFNLNIHSKSINRNIISCILDSEGLNEGHDTFSKETIKIKSVTLNEKNKFNNGMSLNPFSFENIIEEEWETSTLRLTFKKNIFLFVIFKEESPSNIILTKCISWTIDNDILDTKIKDVWEIVKINLRDGKVISFVDIDRRMKTTFPSTTYNGVCFVAAHAHSKKDTSKLPVSDKLTGITDLTKHSFWLTKDYLYDILGITNDITSRVVEEHVEVELNDSSSFIEDEDRELDSFDFEESSIEDASFSSSIDFDISEEHENDETNIRVPLGYDTAENSVTFDDDINKTDDEHIFEEISISFEPEESFVARNSQVESIDELLASLKKKDNKKPVEQFIDDNIEVDFDDVIDDTSLNVLLEDDEVEFENDMFEEAQLDDEINVDEISIENDEDSNDTQYNTEPNFNDNAETPNVDRINIHSNDKTNRTEAIVRKKTIVDTSDPIIDRYSGSQSVETLTARLESNLRKLEAEYSAGLGTLSASGRYSLRGRIEKRVATEMDEDILSYEHIKSDDPKTKKKKDKLLKKSEKKNKKIK